MSDLIAGQLFITINGKTTNAVGSFTLNLGANKREGLAGPDRVHGYKEMPQVPGGKGEIRDSNSVRIVSEILNMTDATIVAKVANGKKYMYKNAWYSGDGDLDTEEGKIQFEWQSKTATEV
jgi:hypothetical protein